jgi:hypothetical protein
MSFDMTFSQRFWWICYKVYIYYKHSNVYIEGWELLYSKYKNHSFEKNDFRPVLSLMYLLFTIGDSGMLSKQISRKHREIVNANIFYSKNEYILNSFNFTLNTMKTTILFVKIDFFFQYFLFRHFVFDNIPESPIIRSRYINDNTVLGPYAQRVLDLV